MSEYSSNFRWRVPYLLVCRLTCDLAFVGSRLLPVVIGVYRNRDGTDHLGMAGYHEASL